MNHLDMYTREKANQAHLDELHREAQDRRLLRDADRRQRPEEHHLQQKAEYRPGALGADRRRSIFTHRIWSGYSSHLMN